MPINGHSEKVRYKIDSYILHRVALAIMLLSMITIIYYDHAKHRSNHRDINALTIQKWKTMSFTKFVLKIVPVIILMTQLN